MGLTAGTDRRYLHPDRPGAAWGHSGIFRAKTETDRDRRRIFSRKAFHDLIVYPVTFEIAELAGRIEGEQAARGNTIAFEDLVIGATVLHLGFDVLTINLRHFQSIPNLGVVTH